MSIDIKKGLVPQLRFPEFEGAGRWKKKTLGEVGEVLMCKRIFADETNDSGGVPFFKIGTLGAKPDAFISKEIFEQYRSKYNFPQKGEVLLTCSGTVGKCLRYNGEDAYYQDSNIVWIDNPTLEVSNELLYYMLSNVNWGNLNSTTITRIYGSDLRGLSIVFPEDELEQQKIAATLSSLDDLIAAEMEKGEALKAHKRGLMQTLFPAEGESVPRVRFEGFEETWEEKQLKDACQMQAGKFVSASNIREKRKEDLFPCYGGNGLRGYTATFTHEGRYPLIGRQGALCGNVTLATGKFHATEHAVVAIPKERVAIDWLYYKLILLNLNQYATGQAQPGLSVENLEKVKIKIPKTEGEQQKIADALSTLDDLITVQSQKIDALKAQKRGLMHGLFPSQIDKDK